MAVVTTLSPNVGGNTLIPASRQPVGGAHQFPAAPGSGLQGGHALVPFALLAEAGATPADHQFRLAFGTEHLQSSWCSWKYADNISASQSGEIRGRRKCSLATEGFTKYFLSLGASPEHLKSNFLLPKFCFPVDG